MKKILQYKKISRNILLSVLAIMILLSAGCSQGEERTLPSEIVRGAEATPVEISDGDVVVYFFWGDGCPHCTSQKPFLEDLQSRYPDIKIMMYETWKNPDNAKLFSEVAKAHGKSAQGVPTTFIGDKVWVGYAAHMGVEMEEQVKSCLENSCSDPSAAVISK